MSADHSSGKICEDLARIWVRFLPRAKADLATAMAGRFRRRQCLSNQLFSHRAGRRGESRLQIMKLTSHNHSEAVQKGFTLIEIIGVLAVIAVLAALLTPKVYDVIARGKVNSTALAYNTIKTATTDYFAQKGSFPLRDGTGSTNGAAAQGRFDADLLAAGMVEKLFSCAIGWQTNATTALTGRTHVRSLAVKSSGTVAPPTPTAGGDNFDLDRDASTADFNSGQTVVSVFIPGVSITDAIALNRIIDGDENTGIGPDIVGKLTYSAATDGVVTACIYVAHY